MANPEHLAILERGAPAWSAWRKDAKVQPNLSGANLSGADLSGTDLTGSNLSGANLAASKLSGADLSGTDLTGAKFTGSNLSGANLAASKLSGADLSGTDLTGAKFTGANLTGANLFLANLTGADLSRATLLGANVTLANLTETDFSGSQFEWTVLGAVDLRQAKGLETVRHRGPSTIGIDTLYQSQGQIPDAFLRGCGVPGAFITYSRSLIGSAIEFYSCFISYSTKDQECADQLHRDLQAQHVRCWLATEDLKIGDKFRACIEESIRLHDKLLLVLSEASIQSPWVEDEVESALERERRENKLVLFPVRLDDAVMQTDVAWAAHLRQKRHIGDLRNWKNHDSYQNALERLVKDLEAPVSKAGARA